MKDSYKAAHKTFIHKLTNLVFIEDTVFDFQNVAVATFLSSSVFLLNTVIHNRITLLAVWQVIVSYLNLFISIINFKWEDTETLD